MRCLRRTLKTIQLFPPEPLNPSHLILSSLQSQCYLHQIHPSSIPSASVSSDRSTIANELVAIFTKRLVLQKTDELRALGAKLTPETVESVLGSLKSWKVSYDFFSWATEQDGYRHNCYTYNTMASILSRAQKTTQLKVLAMDVVKSRCPMTAGACGFLIRCLGSQGLVSEANYVFDQTKLMGLCVPNVYTYNCLLEVLAKFGSVDSVEMRLKEMQSMGWDSDKFTMTPVLQAYCKAGKFQKALDVFNQINERGWVDVHVLSILVVSFTKWGEVDKAFELIERMESLNISLNEKTLCVLIHGFAKEFRMDVALQLFDKMKKLGFRPDLPIYDVLIGGLFKNKELGKALDLYLEMKKSGIFPDVSIITKLISLFCGEGDVATASQLLAEGVERLDAKASVLLYNVFLRGLVNHCSVDKAFLLLQAMVGLDSESGDETVFDNLIILKRKVNPDATSFDIVIDGLCKSGQLDVALMLFRDMVRMGCKGNQLIYNNLIDAFCSLNRLEEGLELLKEMKESGFKPTEFTNNSIFGCLCRREDISGALDTIREMREYGHEPWIKHSSLLAKQLCKHGKVVEASNFLKDMQQEGFLPHITAYSAVIHGFFKIKEVDQAVELFRDICARGYRPDIVAYNIFISGLCKTGRVLEAQNVLDEILEKGLVPTVVTYNLVIHGWYKKNEIDRALLCLSRMMEGGQEPTLITYTTLIGGLCNAGKPGDALRLWNEMVEKGCPPNSIAYMALIHGLCKCNAVDAAVAYLHEMDEPTVVTYTTVLGALCNAGRPEDAVNLWNEMVEKGCSPNRISYMALIHGLCKCCRADAALAYLHEMDKMEMKPDTYIYVELISEFVSNKKFPIAFEILKEMVQKGNFPDPLDKNYPNVIDAVEKLSKDARTSTDVKNLIAEGCIPMSRGILDPGSTDGEEPVS
ncbi:putative pentatricopeptide repeat-containing protein At5g08310, mitochondrial [Macadamia integrifolia]|uniref:putative pentatricopeptide repeat-containing protein At5g08310, mitochondrial n=1 Tax=Macadamia integrifolia TaxID=60698 RepID=UPI001C4FB7DD|nr:putative pentatricopeptide repeat-containing protein At5g08310, mitochondrial [Macadamia integrifolia]